MSGDESDNLVHVEQMLPAGETLQVGRSADPRVFKIKPSNGSKLVAWTEHYCDLEAIPLPEQGCIIIIIVVTIIRWKYCTVMK
mmetsp:Transcript_10992/g.20319  ORF Transcript_10992/g.20319 Transcript_10992/m.20319 type:complete len:83 (+) Transcript_10992:1171-1419(+)